MTVFDFIMRTLQLETVHGLKEIIFNKTIFLTITIKDLIDLIRNYNQPLNIKNSLSELIINQRTYVMTLQSPGTDIHSKDQGRAQSVQTNKQTNLQTYRERQGRQDKNMTIKLHYLHTDCIMCKDQQGQLDKQ